MSHRQRVVVGAGFGGLQAALRLARLPVDVTLIDEATSALDTETERIVQRALDSLMHDRTTISIAHRLSTIRAAHVIFVLDHRQVVERRTHGSS